MNIQQTISNAHRHGAHRPFGDTHMPAQTLPKTAITDLEINKRLALKIGWTGIKSVGNVCCVPGYVGDKFKVANKWVRGRVFDHSAPAVIWPIAERYNIWPAKIVDGYSKGKWMAYGQEHCVTADTAAMAVAMAVIGEAS